MTARNFGWAPARRSRKVAMRNPGFTALLYDRHMESSWYSALLVLGGWVQSCHSAGPASRARQNLQFRGAIIWNMALCTIRNLGNSHMSFGWAQSLQPSGPRQGLKTSWWLLTDRQKHGTFFVHQWGPSAGPRSLKTSWWLLSLIVRNMEPSSSTQLGLAQRSPPTTAGPGPAKPARQRSGARGPVIASHGTWMAVSNPSWLGLMQSCVPASQWPCN